EALVNFTLAPTTTAPFASTTVPLSCPVSPCTSSDQAKTNARRGVILFVLSLRSLRPSAFFASKSAIKRRGPQSPQRNPVYSSIGCAEITCSSERNDCNVSLLNG